MTEHTHHHDHGHSSHAGLRRALLLTLLLAIVEAAGGYAARSLALLSDAGHVLGDALALLLAALAAFHARRRKDWPRAGQTRVELAVAAFNGVCLLALTAAIIVQAAQRLRHPPALPVEGGLMLAVAAFGLLLNAAVARQLHGHHHDLNVRAALLHVLGDLLGTAATLAGGLVIRFTGWQPVDPLLSMLVSLLILLSAVHLLRETARLWRARKK